MEKTTLWITRHGKTIFNTVDRVQGWCDSPLTPDGIAVAEQLGKGLSSIDFGAVYSSDSGRARDTARIVMAKLPCQSLVLQEDVRLREYCFGCYEGSDDKEMKEELAVYQNYTPAERLANARPSTFTRGVAAIAKRRQGDNSQVYDAEEFATVSGRLMQVLQEIGEYALKNQHADVLIVSHGVAIWTIWETLINLEGYEGKGVPNCSIMKLEYESESFKVIATNDSSYLQA
jgi:broad specificity phosphatase PhoE